MDPRMKKKCVSFPRNQGDDPVAISNTLLRGISIVSHPRLRAVIIIIVVVVATLVVLLLAPIESTAFQTIAYTSQNCVNVPCSTSMVEYTVGHFGYMTFTGTWLTNVSTDGNLIVTINNGPSSQPCYVCTDSLYTSPTSSTTTGSFDVSGIGPFHLSVVQILRGAQATTIQGTVGTSVI
jgi:hypothetical protein